MIVSKSKTSSANRHDATIIITEAFPFPHHRGKLNFNASFKRIVKTFRVNLKTKKKYLRKNHTRKHEMIKDIRMIN